jgi:hypothetical protein
MMANDPSQEDFMNMENQGEGNYASAVSSDTRDHKTDQGLTLSPKIQLNDPWLYDAAGVFGDQDLDALLGPVKFDLIVEEACKNGLEVDALFNGQYQLPEPPAKRRKVTRELAEEALPLLETNGSTSQPKSVSVPTISVTLLMYFQLQLSPCGSSQGPSALTPVVVEQQTHAFIGDAGLSPDSLLPVLPPMQFNRLIRTTEQPSLHADFRDGEQLGVDSRGEESEAHILDSLDDDNSLFGDYVSIKEASLGCPPTAEESRAELKAELEAELEAQLEAELMGEFRSSVPAVLLEAGFCATDPSTASTALSKAALHSTDPSKTQNVLLQAGLHATNFSTASNVLLEAGVHTSYSSTISAVLRDPNVPIPSVERDLPERQSSKGSEKGRYNHPRASESPVIFSSLESKLFDLEQKLSQVSSSGSLQNWVDQAPNAASLSEQSHTKPHEPSPSPYHRDSLPLSIALAIATSNGAQSIADILTSTRAIFSASQHPGYQPPPAPRRIPAHLEQLLDSLYLKLKNDKEFRSSVIIWLTNRMAYQRKSTPSISLYIDRQLTLLLAFVRVDDPAKDAALIQGLISVSNDKLCEMLISERHNNQLNEEGLTREVLRLRAENDSLRDENRNLIARIENTTGVAKDGIRLAKDILRLAKKYKGKVVKDNRRGGTKKRKLGILTDDDMTASQDNTQYPGASSFAFHPPGGPPKPYDSPYGAPPST